MQAHDQPVKSGWIATVLLSSRQQPSFRVRLLETEQIVSHVAELSIGDGLVVLPGGWFDAGKSSATRLCAIADAHIREAVVATGRDVVVCAGVDARAGRDQFAVAFGANGIRAAGRKFCPTPAEIGKVQLATSPNSCEFGLRRIFEHHGKLFYIGACYDAFGIRHRRLKNPGVDAVIDLVHRFEPYGQPVSGAAYYARHGFAGAAKQWNCAVFGSAVFRTDIQPKWPSGVTWNQGGKSTRQWRYSDNGTVPEFTTSARLAEGTAEVRFFHLT